MSKAAIGRKLSEDAKRKVGDESRGKHWYNDGERNCRFGENDEIPEGFVLGKIKHSEETKQKIGASSRGRKHSKEAIQKMIKSQQNRSEEWRQKLSGARKGRKWYNDGTKNGFFPKGEEPEGWTEGMFPKK